MLELILCQLVTALIVLTGFLYAHCLRLMRRVSALEAHSSSELEQMTGAIHQHLFDRIRALEARINIYIEGRIQ